MLKSHCVWKLGGFVETKEIADFSSCEMQKRLLKGGNGSLDERDLLLGVVNGRGFRQCV